MDNCSSEVNDFNLRVVLVSLKQDVFRLQVSVDDAVDVHIVDSHEQLLHKDGSLFLLEFAPVDDVVIELAALANLCNNVHVLLILEDLVHLDHVGVVQMLQYLNLVLLDLLFVIAHSAYLQYLHCSLSAKLSVDAHTNLTKCSYWINIVIDRDNCGALIVP